MVTRNRVGAQAVGGAPTTTQTPGSDPNKDNRTPGPPSTLSATSTLEYVNSIYTAAVTLTWTLPTTATDGTAMTPQSTQVLQLKGAGAGVFATASNVDTPDHTVVLHGYGTSTVWQFKVRVYGANGKISAFSNTVTVTMAGQADATPPPMPSTPSLSSRMAMVQIDWDGTAAGGGTMPADFDHCVLQRAPSSSFTPAGTVNVGTVYSDDLTVDGPLTVGSNWYYRLIPYNRLGLVGPASVVGDPVKVVGSAADDITIKTIDASKFTDDLNAQIELAISSTTPNTVPGAHVYLSDTAPTDAVTGDLWFDSSDHNRPKRLSAGGAWVSVRDSIVDDAFKGLGNTITAPYLLPTVVQGQFIAAGTVDATDLIAEGTITAVSGIIGDLSAGVITVGYLSADRIHANTLDSSKLVVADYTNLCDESEFNAVKPGSGVTGAGVGWSDPREVPNGPNGVKAVADHPVSGGAGYVWSVTGNGSTNDATNTRVLPTTETDQFYGEVWVRKMASPTTGQVALLLHVDQKGGGSTTSTICSYTFKVADPPLTWIKISGFIVPPFVAKPAPPNTKAMPTGSYQAIPVLRVLSTVGSGAEVQFASPVIRRKNNANLTVDGSITASQLAAQTITGAEIDANTITAANIFGKTLTAHEIAATSLTADVMDTGLLTAMMVAGNMLRTNQPNVYPAVEITKNHLDYSTAPGISLFQLDFAHGAMYWKSSTTGSRWEIDGSGIRLYQGATVKVNLSTAGNASFAGDLTGSTMTAGTITGVTIQTTATTTVARIVLTGTTFQMVDSTGSARFYLRTTDLHTILRSGTSGARFEIDDTVGISLYNSAGSRTVFLNGKTGSASFKGAITGSTVDATTTITGATIRTDDNNPRILLNDTMLDATNSAGDSVFRLNTPANSMYWRSSANTAKWQLDQSGFRIWDSSGDNTVYLQANGDASFAGDLTGSTMTAGTITGATVQTAVSGARIVMTKSLGLRAYDSTGAYTFYATIEGNAYFSGTVSASTVTGSTINGGKITATVVNAGTINGGSYTGLPTISSPTITNPNSSGGSVGTSGGPERVVLVNDQLQIFSGNVLVGVIMSYTKSHDLLMEGWGANAWSHVGFNNTQGVLFSVNNGGSAGAVYSGAIRDSSISAVTHADAVYCDRTSGFLGVYTSSVRHKQAVAPLALDPAFLDIVTASWTDKPNRASVASRVGNPGLPTRYTGFTAENLHKVGATDMVTYDRHHRPYSISQPAILAHTVRYTQWLVEQVRELQTRVSELEGAST